MHDDHTLTPYAGTSGHSGGPSSEQRARLQDATGGTRRLRDLIAYWLTTAGPRGVTCAEAERGTARGHGAVSGALSRMHKAGEVTRLDEQRHGQEVYVLPEHVGGRTELPYRPHTGTSERDPAWTVQRRGHDVDDYASRRWVEVDGTRYFTPWTTAAGHAVTMRDE